MSSEVQKAVLLDFHSSSLSSPSHINHHNQLSTPRCSTPTRHHVVKRIAALLNSQVPCDVRRLYILISVGSDISSAADLVLSAKEKHDINNASDMPVTAEVQHDVNNVSDQSATTEGQNDVNNISDLVVTSEGQPVHVTVVEAEDRIASFYRAKQDFDNLEVSNITLMCDARDQQFWTHVCQELFTPVHQWEVVVMEIYDPQNKKNQRNEHCAVTANNHIGSPESTIHGGNGRTFVTDVNRTEANHRSEHSDSLEHGLVNGGTTTNESNYDSHSVPPIHNGFNAKSSEPETSDTNNAHPEPLIHKDIIGESSKNCTQSSKHDALVTDPSDPSKQDTLNGDASQAGCSADARVQAKIRGFLKTLPSLLGLPEVERSRMLPGERQGFVHGYSTRRGGVTTLPTLCSMNVVYTDKKRDSLLVVQENRRRLSLAGGFDPTAFHIVKVEHGIRVWTVGEEEEPLKYDALVTNRRDITLAAAGADCIPLLFADPVAMVIGAAHAGWMGTVGKIAKCVVETMGERFGSRPENILVSMGPGLRLGCFRVLKEEGKMFASIHPSCQADSVEPICHKVCVVKHLYHDEVQVPQLSSTLEEQKTGNDVHTPGGQIPNLNTQKNQGTEQTISSQIQYSTTSSDKELKVGNRIGNINKETDTSILVTQIPEETKSSDVNTDVGTRNPSFITLSKHCQLLNGLRVENVPAEQLKPTSPRPIKSSHLQWTFVDLQMTNYHVLLQAGVKAEHIDMSTSHCTKCNPHLYFSYERDGFPFGNQIGFISMPFGALD